MTYTPWQFPDNPFDYKRLADQKNGFGTILRQEKAQKSPSLVLDVPDYVLPGSYQKSGWIRLFMNQISAPMVNPE